MRKTSTRRAPPGARHAGYRLDDQIGFVLRCAYQRASANLLGQIGAHDLTPPQFATLARLHERGCVSQLRLKKRDLVETQRAPDDERLILVSLTRSGAALVEALIPVEMKATARTLAALDQGERKILYELLRRIAES